MTLFQLCSKFNAGLNQRYFLWCFCFLDAMFFFVLFFYHSPQNTFVSVLAGKSRGCSLDLFPSYSLSFLCVRFCMLWTAHEMVHRLRGAHKQHYFIYLFFFPLKCKWAKEISARKMWPFQCFLLSVWAVKVNFCNLHAHFHPALLGQSVPFKLSQLFLIYYNTEGKWIDLGRWEAGIIWCLQYDP